MTKGAPFLSNLWQFLYPHTIIGTVLSILVNSQIALSQASAPRDDAALRAVGVALAAALCMNGYIVGINQCFDVAIDRVNKPYLPLASGAWSLAFGQKVVALEGLAALAIAAFAPGATPALLRTVSVSGLLGTAYSVDMPGLRWKQHPLLASICILSVRGFVVQAGFYQHMVQALDLPTDYAASPVIRLSITFVTILSVAIAFCKDVPDIAGDAKAGVRTLPVRLGARRVLRLVYALMLLCYVVAIAASWRSASATLAHAALAALTVVRAAGTDPDSVGSVRSFYMHVWTCFYLEYLVLLAVAPADVVMPATLADAGSWLGGEAGAALLAVWRTVPYLVPLAVAALAYAKKWLTADGTVAGLGVGLVVVQAGAAASLQLLAFFVAASLASKLRRRVQQTKTTTTTRRLLLLLHGRRQREGGVEGVEGEEEGENEGAAAVRVGGAGGSGGQARRRRRSKSPAAKPRKAVALAPAPVPAAAGDAATDDDGSDGEGAAPSSQDEAKTGRNAMQALATGAVPALLSTGALVAEWRPLYLAYLACCCGDTLASELGGLSSQQPVALRLVAEVGGKGENKTTTTTTTTTKEGEEGEEGGAAAAGAVASGSARWRLSVGPVPKGTDGGVTFAGVAASLLGGALVGACDLWGEADAGGRLAAVLPLPSWVPGGGGGLRSMLMGALLGFSGSALDSLLGSALQQGQHRRVLGAAAAGGGGGEGGAEGVHPTAVAAAAAKTWKSWNTFVNLLSSLLNLGVGAALWARPREVGLLLLFVLALQLLLLAPAAWQLSPFLLRKGLHVVTSALVTSLALCADEAGGGQSNARLLLQVVGGAVLVSLHFARDVFARFNGNNSSSSSSSSSSNGSAAGAKAAETAAGSAEGIPLYTFAVFASATFVPQLPLLACVCGPMFFADPLAAIVGRHVRSPRLTADTVIGARGKTVVHGGKTVAGSAAFCAATWAWFTFGPCSVMGLGLGAGSTALLAVALSAVELGSGNYDNLILPVATALLLYVARV